MQDSQIFGMDKILAINEIDENRHLLNIMRNLKDASKTNILLEEKSEKEKDNANAIAITNDIKFGSNVLQNQIDNFRSAVDGTAEFAEVNEDNVAECPLIFIPKTNNIIFSGIIPSLNNLEFQFVLKTSTGNGCFVWADGLIMNKENMKILVKLQGYYENWKEEWNVSAREFKDIK